MILKSIIDHLEAWAPLSFQENYDNAGLIIGSPEQRINKALLCLDITEAIIDEAIACKCNLIIAHHPILFGGIKKLNGKNYEERVVIKAIKNDIAVYATHTNLDNMFNGVNQKIAEKLDLSQLKILQAKSDTLKKIQFFAPATSRKKICQDLFQIGAGYIGNYTHCSFATSGVGTFMGNTQSNPAVGKKEQFEQVNEERVEMIFPAHLSSKIITSLHQNHPYETPAFDILSVENKNSAIGAGLLGQTSKPVSTDFFLETIKKTFQVKTIRHTAILKPTIQSVALCGGSGSFLLQEAIKANADIFISADFKYHQFFDADTQILIADIGHYEIEQFTPELIQQYLSEKIPTFATLLSKVNTNPINYF